MDTADTTTTQPTEASTPTIEPPSTPAEPSAEMDWMGSLDKALEGLTNPAKESGTPEKKEEKAEIKSEEVPEDAAGGEDEDAEEIPKSMSRSAGAKFKELKSELKDWKTKYAELEKVVNESKPQTPPDYEDLKSKVAEYEKELSVTRVEATEQFKQAVVLPLNQALTAAYSLADKYKVEERVLQEALAETDIDKQSEMLQDLASSFSERDRIGLYRLADDVAVLLKRKEEIKANAQAAYSTLTEQQKKQGAEARAKSLDTVYATLSQKIPLFGNKDIASKVKEVASATDLGTAKPDVQAYAAYAGALLPHIVKEYQAQASKIAELEKTITSFRRTVPKAGGGKQTATQSLSADVGFLEALESHL
jgi:hypothetical protein